MLSQKKIYEVDDWTCGKAKPRETSDLPQGAWGEHGKVWAEPCFFILKSSALSVNVQLLGAEEGKRVGLYGYCSSCKETLLETTVHT